MLKCLSSSRSCGVMYRTKCKGMRHSGMPCILMIVRSAVDGVGAGAGVEEVEKVEKVEEVEEVEKLEEEKGLASEKCPIHFSLVFSMLVEEVGGTLGTLETLGRTPKLENIGKLRMTTVSSPVILCTGSQWAIYRRSLSFRSLVTRRSNNCSIARAPFDRTMNSNEDITPARLAPRT